jgi:hypothetical protein
LRGGEGGLTPELLKALTEAHERKVMAVQREDFVEAKRLKVISFWEEGELTCGGRARRPPAGGGGFKSARTAARAKR